MNSKEFFKNMTKTTKEMGLFSKRGFVYLSRYGGKKTNSVVVGKYPLCIDGKNFSRCIGVITYRGGIYPYSPRKGEYYDNPTRAIERALFLKNLYAQKKRERENLSKLTSIDIS
jgi:hypothetical protein